MSESKLHEAQRDYAEAVGEHCEGWSGDVGARLIQADIDRLTEIGVLLRRASKLIADGRGKLNYAPMPLSASDDHIAESLIEGIDWAFQDGPVERAAANIILAAAGEG